MYNTLAHLPHIGQGIESAIPPVSRTHCFWDIPYSLHHYRARRRQAARGIPGSLSSRVARSDVRQALGRSSCRTVCQNHRNRAMTASLVDFALLTGGHSPVSHRAA